VTLGLPSLVLVTVHVEPETLTLNDDPGVDELPQKQVGGPPLSGVITQQVSRAGVDVPQQEQTAPEMSDTPRILANSRRMACRHHWRRQPRIVKWRCAQIGSAKRSVLGVLAPRRSGVRRPILAR
jgi:hypothetical protein